VYVFRSLKNFLLFLACVCFAIAVVLTAGIIAWNTKIEWTDLGLFFGFLSFLVHE
jgi:hypothetical protein